MPGRFVTFTLSTNTSGLPSVVHMQISCAAESKRRSCYPAEPAVRPFDVRDTTGHTQDCISRLEGQHFLGRPKLLAIQQRTWREKNVRAAYLSPYPRQFLPPTLLIAGRKGNRAQTASHLLSQERAIQKNVSLVFPQKTKGPARLRLSL